MGGLYIQNDSIDPGLQKEALDQLDPSAGHVFKSQLTAMEGPGWAPVRAMDWIQRKIDDPNKLQPDVLKEMYPDSPIKFEAPMSRGQVDFLHEHKQEEMQRNNIWERAQGWGTTAGVFGQLGAGMVDPLTIAMLAFTPARMVAAGGVGILGRLGVMAESESIGTRMAGNFALTTADVGVAMGAAEPLNYGIHQIYQDDYTLASSFSSVLFGSLGGGILHAGGIGVAGAWSKMPSFLGKTKETTHQAAFQESLNKILQGKEPNAEAILSADPNVVVLAQANDQLKVRQAAAKEDQEVAAAKVESLKTELNTTKGEVKTSMETFDKFKGDVEHLVNRDTDLEFGKFGMKIDGQPIHFHSQGIKINDVELQPTALKESDLVPHMQEPSVFNKGHTGHLDGLNKKYEWSTAGFGVIPIEKDGRVWVEIHHDGSASIVKTDSSNVGSKSVYAQAIEGMHEQSGLVTKGLDAVGKFSDENTITHYMVAERTGGMPHTETGQSMALVSLDKAMDLVHSSSDKKALERVYNWMQGGKHVKAFNLPVAPGQHPNVITLTPEQSAMLGEDVQMHAEPSKMDINQYDIKELTFADGDATNLGSNPGAIFEMPDGSKAYVKFPKDPGQAKSETAAHLLYKLADEMSGFDQVPAVAIVTGKNGEQGIASSWIEGLRPIGPKELGERIKASEHEATVDAVNLRALGAGYIMDAWLANRDTFGTAPTFNIFADDAGHYYKLDFGGALDYRAQGQKKIDFGSHVEELDSMPLHSGGAFINALDQTVKETGAAMVMRISPKQIEAALKTAGFEGKELEDMLAILRSRRQEIGEQFPKVAEIISQTEHGKVELYSKKSAIAHVQSEAKAIWNLYTEEERLALSEAVGGIYDLNRDLFKHTVLSEEQIALVAKLDAAATKHSLGQDTTLWRWDATGTKFTQHEISQWGKGTVYDYRGYMHSSLGKNNAYAEDPSRNMLWILSADESTKGAYLDVTGSGKPTSFTNTEFEFMLARGSKLLLEGKPVLKTKANGSTYWEVRAKIHQAPDLSIKDIHTAIKAAEEAKSNAASDVTTTKDQLISDLANNVYYDTLPVLKDRIDDRTPLMKQIDKEIKELEASLKADSPDLDLANLEGLKEVNEGIKKADDFSKAIYQAWTCYKGV